MIPVNERDFIEASTKGIIKGFKRLVRLICLLCFFVTIFGCVTKYDITVSDFVYLFHQKENIDLPYLIDELSTASFTGADAEQMEAVQNDVESISAETDENSGDLPYLAVQPQRRFDSEDQKRLKVTTNKDPLKLRTGPGSNYDEITSMPKGSIVTYVGKTDTEAQWIVVEYKGYYGWACVVNSKTGQQMLTVID